ncbi:MAG: Alkaline phosphatase synthesis transcriptional regulatory protein PhoP [bacterium ADurb.Bin363]|nr:MAG: Alkaline phosphatase synthesis transcriptional regulatory protein PhoP [bacterium ADurb.Bin363]
MSKILIVDDDESIRKAIAYKLKKNNYEVFSASNGIEALIKIREINPDLIILDVIMPGINGYEVLEKLNDAQELLSIPVMMLTGQGELKDKIKGFEKGAYDYLSKPFDHRELSIRVEALLRLRNLQKELIKTERLSVVGKIALNIKQEIEKPLNSIINLSESLLLQDISPSLKKRLNHILESSCRIRRIIQKFEKLQDTPVKNYLDGIKMIDLNLD